MSEYNVTGFVGADAIPHVASEFNRATLINSLRYYLEDRIENEFDTTAKLTVAKEGSHHIRFTGQPDRNLQLRLDAFITRCIEDFIASRM